MPSERLRIAVLHGPNLNLLGGREPALYGRCTLDQIDEALRVRADALDVAVEAFQSNSEGALVDHVQAESSRADGWLVNAAAYTHTSLALRDALVAGGRPFVEVHLSNIFSREAPRRTSMLADVALALVVGFGADSYRLALDGLVAHLRSDDADAGGRPKPSAS